MNDLISVIVPVYNTEKYVQNCIQSILDQSYRNIEVIIINDGSKDNSLELCSSFITDPRVMIIDNINQGLSYTRQMGVDMAKGKYVCSFDSDDFIAPNMLEIMHEEIINNNADICACGRIDILNEQGKSQKKPIVDQKTVIEITTKMVIEKLRSICRKVNASDTWNKLYKRSFLDKAKVKFTVPKDYVGQDFQFNHILLLHCPKCVVLNECYYFHRMFGESMIRSNNRDLQKSYQFIIEEIITESRYLNYLRSSLIKHQIAGIYYVMLYSAAFNISMRYRTFNEIYKQMEKIYINHYSFSNKYPFIKDYFPDVNDKKTFIQAMKNNRTKLLSLKFYFFRTFRMLRRRFVL